MVLTRNTWPHEAKNMACTWRHRNIKVWPLNTAPVYAVLQTVSRQHSPFWDLKPPTQCYSMRRLPSISHLSAYFHIIMHQPSASWYHWRSAHWTIQFVDCCGSFSISHDNMLPTLFVPLETSGTDNTTCRKIWQLLILASSWTVSWTVDSFSLWLLQCRIIRWGHLLTSFALTPESVSNIRPTDAPSVVTHINNDLKMTLERPWASKHFSKDVYISSALMLDNSIGSKKESQWFLCSPDVCSQINSEGCF